MTGVPCVNDDLTFIWPPTSPADALKLHINIKIDAKPPGFSGILQFNPSPYMLASFCNVLPNWAGRYRIVSEFHRSFWVVKKHYRIVHIVTHRCAWQDMHLTIPLMWVDMGWHFSLESGMSSLWSSHYMKNLKSIITFWSVDFLLLQYVHEHDVFGHFSFSSGFRYFTWRGTSPHNT